MDNLQPARTAFPAKDYALTVQRIRQEGQCFITLLGYCLVSPRKHIEDWARDLSEAEFLAFQGIVHRVARAIAAAVPPKATQDVLPIVPGRSALFNPGAPASPC